METLIMSGKERKRLVVAVELKRGKLSVAAAGRLLGVCYRQAKRIWRRFQKKGERVWFTGTGVSPDRGARARNCAPKYWRAIGSGIRILARRWRPKSCKRKDWRWIMRRCGVGWWPRGYGAVGAKGSSIGPGANGGNALARWCSWMGRITIGLRGGGIRRCLWSWWMTPLTARGRDFRRRKR